MFGQFLHSKYSNYTEQILSLLLILLLVFGFYPSVLLAEDHTEEVVPEVEEVVEVEIGESEQEEPEIVEVETGDAIAEVGLDNTANQTNIDTDEIEGTIEVASEEGRLEEVEESIQNDDQILESESGETEEVANEEENDTGTDDVDKTVEIENENEVDVDNGINANSDSGGNIVEEGKEVVIDTGNAVSSADVLNTTNVNIVDSEGFFLLLNNFLNPNKSLDLRKYAEESNNSVVCNTCENLGNSTTTIQDTNNASITNSLIVRSTTGDNESGGDSSIITTGNAYAGANVVNVANTNIVDSNYMLITFNNFGNWEGDFIFPNIDFMNQYFARNVGMAAQNTEIENNNLATVTNAVETGSGTGGNSADGGQVETGNAVSDSNVVNNVNQNLVGGSSFMVLFRVFGDWSGSVFNSPNNIVWDETNEGVQLYFDTPVQGESGNSPLSLGGAKNVFITNNNETDIQNSIQVQALTGDNKVEGEIGEISTGDAYAGANIVNLANTNIVGRNWVLALVNIFGDWEGNVSFGQPDLWIGVEALSGTTGISESSKVQYRYTVMNNGDAKASGIKIFSRFNSYRHIGINESDGVSSDDYGVYLDIEDLEPGETATKILNTRINENLPYGATDISMTSTVTLTETDPNLEDNTEIINLVATKPFNTNGVGSGTLVDMTIDPKLEIIKTNGSGDLITASSTVDYSITIINHGGEAYYSVLTDVLKNEGGNILNREVWDFGTIYPNEEITVTYSMFFNDETRTGEYTNSAQIEAVGRHTSMNPFYGFFYESDIAKSVVHIDGVGVDDIAMANNNGGGGTGLSGGEIPYYVLHPSYEPIVGIIESATEREVLEVIEEEEDETLAFVYEGEYINNPKIFHFVLIGKVLDSPVDRTNLYHLASLASLRDIMSSTYLKYLLLIAILALVVMNSDRIARLRRYIASMF